MFSRYELVRVELTLILFNIRLLNLHDRRHAEMIHINVKDYMSSAQGTV